MNRIGVVPAILAAAILISCGPQGSGGMDRFNLNTQKAPLQPQGALVDVLPDMQPWSYEEVATFGLAYANSNDRLVSCADWTQISPEFITGQRIITFQLGSANLGLGHLRIRRGPLMPDGWHFFQTTSQIDGAGQCSATEQEIAVVPPDQNGRWLPLASFSLYTELDDGSVGDLVVCQMKRWCCLGSVPTCNNITPPCPLGYQTDNINAGTRDVYPFHWQDQFVPIQDVPSGRYWFEHRINAAGVLIESDYTNNSLWFKIEINREADTVQIVEYPDGSVCPQ
jgi:lysyl oxidase